jgi:predicted fused transcriptional regulator/phosphomethylpyrimidine kinase
MTDQEQKQQLDEAIQFFEDFINVVLPQGLEGVEPMAVMKNYNLLRNELSKLYVDLD